MKKQYNERAAERRGAIGALAQERKLARSARSESRAAKRGMKPIVPATLAAFQALGYRDTFFLRFLPTASWPVILKFATDNDCRGNAEMLWAKWYRRTK
jgi:hypothetical protein